ncbi:MAG: hypothetical protein ACM3UW_06920 [Bacillota bacterium]
MSRAWLLPLAIAIVIMLVQPLSGIHIGTFEGSIIQIILAAVCLVTALVLIPRQSSSTCKDNRET